MHLNMNDKGAEDLFGYIEDESGKQSKIFVDVKQLLSSLGRWLFGSHIA